YTKNVQAGIGPNPVGNEIWRVLGSNNSLAHAHVAKMRNSLDGCTIGFRRGNDLQQAHVARGIEEVRAKPVPAEVLAESLGNTRHRQPARIRGYNAPRLARGFNLPEQGAFDLQVFSDSFNDPVGVGDELHVIFKIADCEKPLQPLLKECCRL